MRPSSSNVCRIFPCPAPVPAEAAPRCAHRRRTIRPAGSRPTKPQARGHRVIETSRPRREPRTRAAPAARNAQVAGAVLSKAGLSGLRRLRGSNRAGAKPAAESPTMPWSNCPRSAPSRLKRWIMPVSRSAAKSWRDAGSNARPPSAGPELGTPASTTLANKLTAPVTPWIFQIEPGPPSTVIGPNSPGMKAAFGAPRARGRAARRRPYRERRSATRTRTWRRHRCWAGSHRPARLKTPVRSGRRSP